MQTLSAADAISPAFSRTKLVLFTPFRLGRTWKLAATAYVSCTGALFAPFPLLYLWFLPEARHWKGSLGVALLISSVLIATAIFLAVFHLCSRLQFAFFDIMLNRGEFVAPAWRKYGSQARKLSAVKVLIGTAATFVVGIPAAVYVRHVIPVFESLQPGEPPPPEFLTAFFIGYGMLFLGFGALYLIGSLLSDFVLPSLALEDTSLKEAFRRVAELVKQEPGQFALYVLLKTLLGIFGYFAVMIAFEIALLLVVAVVAGIAFLIGLLLHAIGVPTNVLSVLAAVIGFPAYLFVVFYGMFLVIGSFFTFFEAYALYFLGGRYPLLGDLLTASTPIHYKSISPADLHNL